MSATPKPAEDDTAVEATPAEDDDGDADLFENFKDLLHGMDVVDEVGASDDEEVPTKRIKRERSRERRRSPPRRRRSPPRRSPPMRAKRRRSPPSRKSPPRRPLHRRSRERDMEPRSRPVGGGANSFLADLEKTFGTFEELEKVKQSANTNSNRMRSPRRSRTQANQMNGPTMPCQMPMMAGQMPPMMMMMNNPMGMNMNAPMGMPMDPNMNMNMMGQYPIIGPPGVDQPIFPPGMLEMPQQQQLQMQPMMMQPQIMQPDTMLPEDVKPFLQSPQVSRSRRSDSRSRRDRSRSRSPRRLRRSRSRSRDRYRNRTSRSRERNSRSISHSRTNPPFRPNIDLSEITSQLFLDNKIGLSDFLQTKMAGTTPGNYGRPMDSHLPLSRVVSKLKAATHILENKNDIEYNLKFLFVPPKNAADVKNVTAASPIYPTKRNPLFRLTTDRMELIPESRPFPLVPAKITELLRLLGMDESVIEKQLETNVVTDEFIETRDKSAATGDAARGGAPPTPSMQYWSPQPVPPPRPQMQDMATQTPALCCRRCEDQDRRKLVSEGTQTKLHQQLPKHTQTSETDFTLAKLRGKSFNKEFAANVKQEHNNRPYEDPTKDIRLAPPGATTKPGPRNMNKERSAYDYKFGFN